jgi:hypothetical protein
MAESAFEWAKRKLNMGKVSAAAAEEKKEDAPSAEDMPGSGTAKEAAKTLENLRKRNKRIFDETED